MAVLYKGSNGADNVTFDGGDNYALGRKGHDQINGQGGNDILEGNGGNDDLRGGDGHDTLFGGVGNDRLEGGDGGDTFSMRLWRGGDNVITDFNLGIDGLSLVLNRQHHVLANDLVAERWEGKSWSDEKMASKVEARELKIDDKLGDNVDRISSRLDYQVDHSLSGEQQANQLVGMSVANVIIEVVPETNDLMLHFDDMGSSIRLQNLANHEAIKPLLNGFNGGPDSAAIMALLTNPGHIIGTSGDDVLAGTGRDDRILALGGDDMITGDTGNDYIDGGEGFDTASWKESGEGLRVTSLNRWSERGKEMSADADNPVYIAQAGVDKLNYNEVNAVGGQGVDNLLDHGRVNLDLDILVNVEKLIGSDHSDVFLLRESDDVVDGGAGNDWIQLGDGNNTALGGEGNDKMFAGDGDDVLHGGYGEDVIEAGAGNDQIRGDHYVAGYTSTTVEDDIIDGGEGYDSLWYNDNISGATHLEVNVTGENTFSVAAVDANGQAISVDTVSNVEELHGTRGDDVIDFSGLGHGMTYIDKWTGAGNEHITGSDFNDVINTMHGDDTIMGGRGDDYIDGGHGVDTLVYASTNISVTMHGASYRQEYAISAGDEGVDIVKNIEFIQVGDNTYSLDEMLS